MFDAYAACTFPNSDGDGDFTHFFDGGKFLLCGNIDRKKGISLDVINPFAKDTKTINIPKKKKEDRYDIIDTNADNGLALIETSYRTPPTKNNPIGDKVYRYFLIELASGNLMPIQPILPADCEMVAPELAVNGTAIVYSLWSASRRYVPELRQWDHSGCEEDQGLYLFTFKDGKTKRLSQTSITSKSAISPSGNRVVHLAPKDPETGNYYNNLLTLIDDNNKTISVNALLSEALPNEKILLSRDSKFSDDDTLLGVFYTGESEPFESAVLYRLSLTSGKATILDRIPFEAPNEFIQIASLSDDRTYLAYNINSSDGVKARVMSIEGGKIVAEWNRSISSFRWGPETVFVPLKEDRKKFETVDLTSGKQSIIALNPLAFNTIQNEPGRKNRVFLTPKDREYARIIFHSITPINDRVFFIANASTHFCNAYLFSSEKNGNDVKLLSGAVRAKTCGAVQIIKRDEKSTVFLYDNSAKRNPQFYLIDSKEKFQHLYQP